MLPGIGIEKRPDIWIYKTARRKTEPEEGSISVAAPEETSRAKDWPVELETDIKAGYVLLEPP